jgi:alpha-1,3-mannosyltransferase
VRRSLFAPGLAFLLLLTFGFWQTIPRLALCAVVQLVLGLPFLLENPAGYMERAFNFGRQFDYTWTVNWRLISQETFLDRRLHLVLLGLHIGALVLFWLYRWSAAHGAVSLFQRAPLANAPQKLTPTQITAVLFTSNLIGMAFARSLHYQFYVWYFHTLTWLVWFVPALHPVAKCALLLAIEYCWNVYPSTPFSSGLLHACHAVLLVALWAGGSWGVAKKGDNAGKHKTT